MNANIESNICTDMTTRCLKNMVSISPSDGLVNDDVISKYK